VGKAHNPIVVVKRLCTILTGFRSKERGWAKMQIPFNNKCAESGDPLDRVNAVLDEINPELGYKGGVQWVCQVANNSGLGSCGKCKGPRR
jgi:hypothetical protein